MAATSTLQYPSRGPGLMLGFVALVLTAVVCGYGIAVGEVEAMVGSLAVIAAIAALIDYRAGAVLLMIMLPIEGVWFFPHSMFGLTGLNPLNALLATTLISFVLRGKQLAIFKQK